ncbi:MAG TPA: aminopeptidase P family N-terminal domain-containing protein [Mycobacterium sp.]|nr:aminopeptidase P family N-terminal domain-containing protein [Mycobacterium sp.]
MSTSRFPSDVYGRRLEAAAAAADRAGVAGLVVTPGYDLRYLLGSRAQTFERLTALVIPAGGAPVVVLPRLELAALRLDLRQQPRVVDGHARYVRERLQELDI